MRALIISADLFEDSELAEPMQQLQAKGVKVDLAAPHQGRIRGKHGHSVAADLALEAVKPDEYQLLLLPGGKAPAGLAKHPHAVAIARHFLLSGKPVAAICHGPQILIPTSELTGRTATCYHGMRQELEVAGVNYLDREVVVDGNLITARQPSDIPAFMQAIFKALEGVN
jgi:protease I